MPYQLGSGEFQEWEGKNGIITKEINYPRKWD